MPVATAVVEIVVQGTAPTTGSGAKNIFNVFHYYVGGGVYPSVATAKACADVFNTNVWTPIAARLSADYTGVIINARYLDDATNAYVPATAVPASGGVALPRMPTDVAVVTPFRCFLRGKNFRGSKHFGPIATADVLKDELTAAAVTAWATPVAAMLALQVVAGVQMTPFVLSRTLSQLRTNPTNIQGSVVNAVLLNKTIGTMRRRKEKTQR